MKLPALFIAILGLMALQKDPLALFLLRVEDPASYKAHRRMDGWWGDSRGFVEASTEYNAGKFFYQITKEGGSGLVIKHALRPSLENERTTPSELTAFGTKNYAFSTEAATEELTPLRILPKRKTKELLDGFLYVRAEDGELVRAE